jgi:hypothetical protein
MIDSCFLETPVKTSYYRNNRSTKQKSLRCFPDCSQGGHVRGGFCGQALKCRMLLKNAYKDRPINISDYVFIAEIRPSDKPQISSLKTVNKAELMSKVRTRQDKEVGVLEIFMGEVEVLSSTTDELDLLIIFNGRHQSWDYSWRSNRWTNEQHVVDVIVLTYSSPTEYSVVSHFTTSDFFLLSSHKRSTSNEDVIHDKVRTKKSRGDGSSRRVSSAGLSSSVAMFTERFDLSGKRRASAHHGSDSELLEASHALSRMSKSAIGAFEDFDGEGLPFPTFVPGTNTLTSFEYIPSTSAESLHDEAVVSPSEDVEICSTSKSPDASEHKETMIMLPTKQEESFWPSNYVKESSADRSQLINEDTRLNSHPAGVRIV